MEFLNSLNDTDFEYEGPLQIMFDSSFALALLSIRFDNCKSMNIELKNEFRILICKAIAYILAMKNGKNNLTEYNENLDTIGEKYQKYYEINLDNIEYKNYLLLDNKELDNEDLDSKNLKELKNEYENNIKINLDELKNKTPISIEGIEYMFDDNLDILNKILKSID
jgi:transcriptional regulator of heat shock response